MVRFLSKFNFLFNRTSIGFFVQTFEHVHEFMNNVDFLNISLWFLDREVTTLFVVQALCAWPSEP